MKKLLNLICKWVLSLFRTKKKPTVNILEKRIEEKEILKISKYRVPMHNNRKITRGRKVQYINMGDFTRPIYHTVVNN